jgi:mannosyltransferase OCH1-like enzyme
MYPCTQVYLHDPVDSVSFLKKYYPTIVPLYESLRPGAYRTDIVRLCLLETFGGMYSDMSLRFLEPFSIQTDLLLVNDINFRSDNQGVGITNGLIKSTKNHPLIHAMIQHVLENVSNKIYNESSLDVTGPIALRKCWEHFFGEKWVSKGTQGEYTAYHNNIPFNMFLLDFRQVNPFNKIEYNGKYLVQCKFEGYQDLMYGHFQTKPYWQLWNERNVYM